jgi:hypothetical protein
MMAADIENLVRAVTKKWANYPLNDIREFLSRRTWLVGDNPKWHILTKDEYRDLMKKTLKLPKKRADWLRAFIQGWTRAKR